MRVWLCVVFSGEQQILGRGCFKKTALMSARPGVMQSYLKHRSMTVSRMWSLRIMNRILQKKS